MDPLRDTKRYLCLIAISDIENYFRRFTQHPYTYPIPPYLTHYVLVKVENALVWFKRGIRKRIILYHLTTICSEDSILARMIAMQDLGEAAVGAGDEKDSDPYPSPNFSTIFVKMDPDLMLTNYN